jgi:hypothetical protein
MVTPTGTHGPADYQIIIKGKLGDQWSDWFAGMTIASDGDITILTGTHIDQSALHGLLVRIRDLGLPLISVERIQEPLPRDGASLNL